jgi:hypothetical protein
VRTATSALPAAGVLVAWGREVVEREGQALQALAGSLDDSFAATVRLLAETVERGGRVLIS